MKDDITKKAKRLKSRKQQKKILKRILIVILFMLFLLYLIITFIFNSWGFTILLDKNLYDEKGIIIYDNKDYKVYQSQLYAESLEHFDNMAGKWLPNDLTNTDGSHNGDNYVAYTFYVEHMGEYVTDYWWEINIENVVKSVDDAIRVRIHKNDEVETFAKIARNGRPEPDTTPFIDNKIIALKNEKEFSPGDIHKFTIVIWLEGNDPECVDEIIGGHIKISMSFNSELKEK